MSRRLPPAPAVPRTLVIPRTSPMAVLLPPLCSKIRGELANGGAREALRWNHHSYTGAVGNKRCPGSSRCAVFGKAELFSLPAAPCCVGACVLLGTGWEWGAAPPSPGAQFMAPVCSGEKPSANSAIQPQRCSCCWRSCWLVHNVGE